MAFIAQEEPDAFIAPEAPDQEKEQPFFDISDTISGAWDALKALKVTAPAAYYRAIHGLARPDTVPLKAQAVFEREAANAQAMQEKSALLREQGEGSEFGDIMREQVAPSLGFTAGSLGAAIPAAKAGAMAGAPFGPVGSGAGVVIGGMAGSGTAAYRMAGNEILQRSFEQMEQISQARNGRPMTEEEKEQAYQIMLPKAQSYAAGEALPEAVGNVALLGAGKVALNIGGKTLASVADPAAKAALRVGAGAAALGSELATETATALWQDLPEAQLQAIAEGKPVDQAKGRFDVEGGTGKAFEEILWPTIGTMGMLAGGTKAIDLGIKGIRGFSPSTEKGFVAPEAPDEEAPAFRGETITVPDGRKKVGEILIKDGKRYRIESVESVETDGKRVRNVIATEMPQQRVSSHVQEGPDLPPPPPSPVVLDQPQPDAPPAFRALQRQRHEQQVKQEAAMQARKDNSTFSIQGLPDDQLELRIQTMETLPEGDFGFDTEAYYNALVDEQDARAEAAANAQVTEAEALLRGQEGAATAPVVEPAQAATPPPPRVPVMEFGQEIYEGAQGLGPIQPVPSSQLNRLTEGLDIAMTLPRQATIPSFEDAAPPDITRLKADVAAEQAAAQAMAAGDTDLARTILENAATMPSLNAQLDIETQRALEAQRLAQAIPQSPDPTALLDADLAASLNPRIPTPTKQAPVLPSGNGSGASSVSTIPAQGSSPENAPQAVPTTKESKPVTLPSGAMTNGSVVVQPNGEVQPNLAPQTTAVVAKAPKRVRRQKAKASPSTEEVPETLDEVRILPIMVNGRPRQARYINGKLDEVLDEPDEADVQPSPPTPAPPSTSPAPAAVQEGETLPAGTGSQQARGSTPAAPAKAPLSEWEIAELKKLAEERREEREENKREARRQGLTDEIDTMREVDDGDDIVASPSTEGPAGGINSFHVEKVKRELSATEYGQWVLDRVEVYETPEQAAKSFGIPVSLVGTNQGIYQPKSRRAAVILQNVNIRRGETPTQALRRVMVHETVGHGGISGILQVFPELETELFPIMDQVEKEGWSYRLKDGSQAKITLTPDTDPARAPTTETRQARRDALFQEWFSRAIENASPEELAQGKAEPMLQRAWNALMRFIARLLGRPYINSQQEAYDLAKKIMAAKDSIPATTMESGGGVVGGGVSASPADPNAPISSSTEEIAEPVPLVKDGTQNAVRWTPPPPKENWLSSYLGGIYHKYLQPVLSVADSINPKIGNILRLHAFEKGRLEQWVSARSNLAFKALDRLNPRLRETLSPAKKKQRKADAEELFVAIDGKDKERAYAIVRKYGATDEEVAQLKELFGEKGLMSQLLQQKREAGIKMGDRGPDYFPRYLRPEEKARFLQWLRNNGKGLDLDPIVDKLMRDKGLTEQDLKNNPDLANELQAMALRQRIATDKDRRIEYLRKQMAQFYLSPSEALQRYGASHAWGVSAARIFGKRAYHAFTKADSATEGDLANMTPEEANAVFDENDLYSPGTPMGKVVNELKSDGKLSVQEIEDVRKMIIGLLEHKSPGKTLRIMRELNMLLTIWNPLSAIKQVPSEYALASGKYGWVNTMETLTRGLLKGWEKAGLIDVQQHLGLNPIFEIAHRGDKISRLSNFMARLSQFQRADMAMANLLTNSYMTHLQKMSPEQRLKEVSQYKSELVGEDKDAAAREVADAIGNGNFTDPNALKVAYFNLTKDRPTSLASMPMGFLQAQGLNMLPYTLRGWGLNNFDRHRKNIYLGLTQGTPQQKAQATANAVWLLSLMVVAGAAGDEAVDWMLGKPVDFSDSVKENLAKLALSSQYSIDKLTGERPDVSAVLGSYLNVPFLQTAAATVNKAVMAAHDDEKSFMDYTKDDKSILRVIPLGLGITARALMGGAGEDAAKAIERELPDNVKALSKEADKLSKMGEEARKKDAKARTRWEQLSAFSKLKSYYQKKAETAATESNYQEAEASLAILESLANSPMSWKSRASGLPRE